MKVHAIGCFGEDVVKLVISAKEGEVCSSNIFTALMCQGQKSVTYSHYSHMTKVCACVVKWVTESH